MSTIKEQDQKAVARATLVNGVKTPLGFFVLLVLVAETVLGGIAATNRGEIQVIAISGMMSLILILIAVVSLFAYWKPDALLGRTPAVFQEVQVFCNQLSGHWWERIIPGEPVALSLVEIHSDPMTNTIKMNGRAYSRTGDLAAQWESVASCVHAHDRKVFYYWKGLQPSRPNEPFEGFGEMSFHASADLIETGEGVFSDSNLTDMKATTRKSVTLRRCTDQERNSKPTTEVITKILDSMF